VAMVTGASGRRLALHSFSCAALYGAHSLTPLSPNVTQADAVIKLLGGEAVLDRNDMQDFTDRFATH